MKLLRPRAKRRAMGLLAAMWGLTAQAQTPPNAASILRQQEAAKPQPVPKSSAPAIASLERGTQPGSSRLTIEAKEAPLVGAVLRPGDELMHISPTNRDLTIEVKFNPVDIRTSSRTILQYLGKPFFKAFGGALNER